MGQIKKEVFSSRKISHPQLNPDSFTFKLADRSKLDLSIFSVVPQKLKMKLALCLAFIATPAAANFQVEHTESLASDLAVISLDDTSSIDHNVQSDDRSPMAVYADSESSSLLPQETKDSSEEITLKCGAQGVIGGKIQRYVLEGTTQLSNEKLGFYKLPRISLFESPLTDSNANKPVFIDVEALPYKKLGCEGHYCLSQSFYHPSFGSKILFNVDSDAIGLYIRAYDEQLEKIIFISGSCSY
jgi:hypothetical protein